MNPKNLKYTKEHEWVKIEGDIAVVGVTDFAQHELTDVVFVELPAVGKKATASTPIAVIESVKSVSDIFAPVSGEIIEVNNSIVDAPEIINKDPYGKGWLLKIKIEDKKEAEQLLSAEQYEEFIKEAH